MPPYSIKLYLQPRAERWETLWLPTARIDSDLPGCLRQIGAALITLGGSMLNQPDPVTE